MSHVRKPNSLLGEGGFGYVFKGWIDDSTHLPSKPGSGMVIAVKKLKPGRFQGHNSQGMVGENDMEDFDGLLTFCPLLEKMIKDSY